MKISEADNLMRPETTLVIASSVDGRLTGNDSADLDRDKHWKQKEGVRGYLQQAYDLSGEKGVYNLVPGRSMAQTGINLRTTKPVRENLRLIVLDHLRDLTPQGITYLAQCVQNLIIICGISHPITMESHVPRNLSIIKQPRLNRKRALEELFKRKVNKITIQSSGKLNAKWLNDGLVDYLTIIVYPLMVGSSGTPILESRDISTVRPLRLIEAKPFNFNYIAMNYQVINE